MWSPIRWCTAILALYLGSALTPALAAVPQTIVVDGVNDFDPSNQIDDDTGDTEIKNWCTNDPEPEGPMDIGKVFMTNDANFLYFGYFYDKDCFTSPSPQLGLAIDLNDPAGGASDPFTRKVGWANLSGKPDYVVYDVLDGFNFEVLYEWNGSSWSNISNQVNPSYGTGSNGLGMVENTGFVEFRLPLSVIDSRRPGGLIPGDSIRVEFWMTQDGATKGPLDAVFSDGVQLSTPSGTKFDTTGVVQMTTMRAYVIQSAVDNAPPTVSSACAVGFPLLGNKQFGLTTNKVDVVFSEPVEAASANNPANYAITNTAATVTGAVRDGAATNIVHLTLSSHIQASANFFDVTVTGVKDLAGNTIVANGNTNRQSFFIKNVRFEGNFAVPLCKGVYAPSDTFAVEGSLGPLSFSLCDNAVMTLQSGQVYAVTVPFCVSKNKITGKAETQLQWKLSAKCTDFEPRSNREHLISSDNGALDVLSVFWNDDDPANFTDHPIDVFFKVNLAAWSPTASDTVRLHGSEAPLSFATGAGLLMFDNGTNGDDVAGDKIYARLVRFPACAAKNVGWKISRNSTFECFGQGDRNVFLNDAVFDTVGGAKGPINLPPRRVDRCTVTDKAVTVVFRVKMHAFQGVLQPGDTVAVMGGVAPLTFTPPPPVAARMKDDGTGFDSGAGDLVYTTAVTFPDSSSLGVNYKFWRNGQFECVGAGDRFFSIDDVNHSTGTPQFRPVAIWDFCSDDVVGVPEPVGENGRLALLHQNFPNPFGSHTTIRFDLARPAAVSLAVYDVAGRRVATLAQGAFEAGPHRLLWNGRDAGGRRVASGVYFYELAVDGEKSRRGMVLFE